MGLREGEIKMKFSENLINLRKSKGMSQEDLARSLDVTRQTYLNGNLIKQFQI